MTREDIRNSISDLVRKFDTTDPNEICDNLGIARLNNDLGSEIMGYRLQYKRISIIVLNTRNTEQENYVTCCHELGHHVCGHSTNTEFLKHSNLVYVRQGVEYEANVFMVELLTYDANAACFSSEEQLLKSRNVPKWAERYVDWNYIKNNADLSSFDSIY